VLRDFGSQLHLSGEGGDAILSPPVNFLVDLARMGDWQRLREFAQARARLTTVDPEVIRQKAVYDAARQPADDYHKLAKQLLNPTDLRSNTQPSNYSWFSLYEQGIPLLTATMRRQLAEHAEQLADTQPRPHSDMATAESLEELRATSESLFYLRRRAAAFGIELHAPFLDHRVIRSTLQTPAHMRTQPGAFKYILPQAFGEHLPAALRSRTSKSNFSGESYRGLRASWDDVLRLFTQDCHLAGLGIIEPRHVIDELYRLDTGQAGLLGPVRQIIQAEQWVRLREGAI
jgi:asparagine synthase (glutamine-hydrolysing)